MIQAKLTAEEMLQSGADHARGICPVCDGGRSKEVSFSCWRNTDGSVGWKCWRASCGIAGGDCYRESLLRDSKPTTAFQPFDDPLESLGPYEIEQINGRFGIDWSGWKWSRGRIALPILRPDGTTRGYVLRVPWWIDTDGPKAITRRLVEGEPMQSWHRSSKFDGNYSRLVVLVEDQVSAIKIAENTWADSVALLGTGMNQQKAAEIARERKDVIIALDADATGTAFAMARKWGMAWPKTRVAILDRDPKDTPAEELSEVLGV